MGKYSGILLCSDFDGTFYVDKNIPEDNIKAVKHFRDNGGRFTIASGRHVEFLTNAIKDVTVSAPLIHLNGALIYDRDSRTIIKERFMSGMTKALVLRLAKEIPGTIRFSFFLKGGAMKIPVEEIDSIPEEYARDTYKVVMIIENSDSEKSNVAVAAIKEIVGDRFIVTRSSWGCIEILDPILTKGRATHYLKDCLGADTLVCVGDFENDLDMVRDADIGYAVSNAADCLKNIADRVTVSARDGAIARIIEEL